MLPLSRYAALRSTDRALAERAIRVRHPGMYDFVTHGPDDWSIAINAVDLGRCKISVVETGACSLSHRLDGVIRLFLPLSHGLALASRGAWRSVTAGQLVLGPMGQLDCSFSSEQRSLIVALPQKALQEILAEFEWQGDLAQRLDQLFLADGEGVDPIARHLLGLIRALEQAPEAAGPKKRFFAAHDELLLLQIARVVAAEEQKDDKEKDARSTTSATYLSRALDFMHAHLFEEIGPTAVARAAGCSLRNLQLLFQRDFGETISGRLRHLRLEAARQRLAHPQEQDTITTIATDCGFSHLSDFARHYRQQFGELPSVTLARMRGLTTTHERAS